MDFRFSRPIHILGLTVSVGTLFWFDLRLLGVSMVRCPVSEVYRRLMPWMLSGFALMITSGGLLFTGFATKAYGSIYFRLKVLAIVCAGVNALCFHLVTERRIGHGTSRHAHPGRRVPQASCRSCSGRR